MEVAYLSTTARGSSTACILCLENERLHASNLGDSGERRAGFGVRVCGGMAAAGVGGPRQQGGAAGAGQRLARGWLGLHVLQCCTGTMCCTCCLLLTPSLQLPQVHGDPRRRAGVLTCRLSVCP